MRRHATILCFRRHFTPRLMLCHLRLRRYADDADALLLLRVARRRATAAAPSLHAI